MLAVFILASALGAIFIAALIEPYSSYERIVNEIFAPLYRCANNWFADVENHFEAYTFYSADVWFKSAVSLAAAVASFLLLAFLSREREKGKIVHLGYSFHGSREMFDRLLETTANGTGYTGQFPSLQQMRPGGICGH